MGAGKTVLLWIPDHHGIAGNEEADVCAKQVAAIIAGAPRSISFAAAGEFIRRTLTDPAPCHCRTKEVYTKTFSWPTDSRAASTRLDTGLLDHVRADHTPHLKAFANRLDTMVNPKCPSQGEEPQTEEHRQQLFGEPSPPRRGATDSISVKICRMCNMLLNQARNL